MKCAKQPRVSLSLFAAAALTLGVLATAGTASPAVAGALENLERERAILLTTYLDPVLEAEARAEQIEIARRRLIDLERMAMRDPDVQSDSRPIARRVFADYDLTFLAHASVEREVSALDLWLDRVGLSTSRVMAARVGRR